MSQIQKEIINAISEMECGIRLKGLHKTAVAKLTNTWIKGTMISCSLIEVAIVIKNLIVNSGSIYLKRNAL